ncbi:MAG: bifunctional ornithine acetyltransferase/N-acetylglutamate synthase [Rickettsiales bacterium]|nr:bifunctional ornithine acetyltransferase/N-acetylglutamate synthase [Rickettsiales bacterium]
MSLKISPFAPKKNHKFSEIIGVSVSSTNCGLKKNNKADLVLIKFDFPSNIISFFTNSKTPGAPVIWNKSISKYSKVSAILINSGNANVFTGKHGKISVKEIVENLAKELRVPKEQIYIASTGVIGEKLDYKKILNKIPFLIKKLKNDQQSWQNAADAIRTTDTYSKIVSLKSNKGNYFTLNGIAKGSGMISPNMATMLAFIFTDFEIKENLFKKKISGIIDNTFNSITVDGDTSTSDMVLIVSVRNEISKKRVVTKKVRDEFFLSLEDISQKLSLLIVKDGEGASKFISIHVLGAKNNDNAKKVAFSIGNSPLFKTSLSGSELNWGRIIMAIGKANVKINQEKVSIKFGKYFIIKNGEYISKNRNHINKYIKTDNIDLIVDLGVSNGQAKIWTCDLTKEYIKINTDYLT